MKKLLIATCLSAMMFAMAMPVQAQAIAIEPQYDQAYSFSEGLANVRTSENKGDNCFVIDTAGKEIIPAKYYYVNIFSEGLAAFLDKKRMGVYR